MKSILFQFGPIQVPAYGFMIMLGFMGAMLLAYHRAKLTGVRPEIVIDLGIYGMITGILGARLWYIAQYNHFFDWKLFNFQDGGFSILGFIAGILVFIGSYRNLDNFFYCGLTFIIRGMLEYHEYIARPFGKPHLLDLAVLVVLAGIAYTNREQCKNIFGTKRKVFFIAVLLLLFSVFTARLVYMGFNYSTYYSDHWPAVQTKNHKLIQVCVSKEEYWKKLCETYKMEFHKDKRFKNNKKRIENRPELSQLLSPYFLSANAEDWLKKLKAQKIPAKMLKDEKGRFIPGDSFGLFKIWRGGMVSFGGLFFAAFVLCFIVAKYKLPLARVTDFCAPGIPFGIGITRGGCFLNGCCYGGVPESSYFIGVNYPKESLCWYHHLNDLQIVGQLDKFANVVHAAQFYESIATFFIFLFLTWWYPRRRKEGDMLFLLGMCYGVSRFLVEQVRDDTPIVAFGRNIGELTGITLFVVSLFCLLNLRHHWFPIMKYLSFLDPLKGSEVDYQPEKR